MFQPHLTLQIIPNLKPTLYTLHYLKWDTVSKGSYVIPAKQWLRGPILCQRLIFVLWPSRSPLFIKLCIINNQLSQNNQHQFLNPHHKNFRTGLYPTYSQPTSIYFCPFKFQALFQFCQYKSNPIMITVIFGEFFNDMFYFAVFSFI